MMSINMKLAVTSIVYVMHVMLQKQIPSIMRELSVTNYLIMPYLMIKLD